jgi:hypothetical protein
MRVSACPSSPAAIFEDSPHAQGCMSGRGQATATARTRRDRQRKKHIITTSTKGSLDKHLDLQAAACMRVGV